MKRLLLAALVAAVSGCGNLDILDTNYTFTYALTRWPDGSMKKIAIRQWRDYEGEQIQVIGKDGNIYLLSTFNTVLVREKED